MTGVLIRFYCICQVASNDAKIWKEEIFGPVLSGPKINHLAFFAPCSCEENRSFAKTGSGHNRKKEKPTKLHHHHHSSTGKTTNPARALLYALHAVRTFKTEEEAVQMANDTTYGLADGVFSQVMISEKQLFPFHNAENGHFANTGSGQT
jgi:hypothetical protein